MSQYFRPISISLSPNVEKDDVKLALNLVIRPWLWRGSSLRATAKQSQSPKSRLLRRFAPRNDAIGELENEFAKYLGVKYAVSFNSGRSAFYAILKAMEMEQGSNVLLQAFTCNAVPNPVLWAGLNPIYVDCNKDDFNISVEDLNKKIAEKRAESRTPRVLVVQHTFGLPANLQEIISIAQQNNLILIEDCAHSLGAEFENKKVGTFGKASFFSFSRDKVISSVYGGMAVTNDPLLGEKLLKIQGEFGMPSVCWTMQQILHPILLNFIILPIYNLFDLGKMMLVFSQITHVLSKAVSWQEKQGKKPNYFPKALPNAMAVMALNQFSKLEIFNKHRQEIAKFYFENLKDTKFALPAEFSARKNIFLRFTVKHKNAHEILYEAWHKQNILLGDWYTTAIAPFDTKMEEMKYKAGTCPNAESLAKQTLNLPTHINISLKEVARIVNFLKQWK